MASEILLLLGAASLCGFKLAYIYGHKTKRFHLSEYLALLAVPVIGSLLLAFIYGVTVLYFFFVSSIVGFVLEYGLGYAYHSVLNKRLWTYDFYNVGGYTSILTLPMWGVAGVVFWLVARSLGL